MRKTFKSELVELLKRYSSEPGSPVFNLVVPVEKVADHLIESTRGFILREVRDVIRNLNVNKNPTFSDLVWFVLSSLDERPNLRKVPTNDLVISIRNGSIYVNEMKFTNSDRDEVAIVSNN